MKTLNKIQQCNGCGWEETIVYVTSDGRGLCKKCLFELEKFMEAGE